MAAPRQKFTPKRRLQVIEISDEEDEGGDNEIGEEIQETNNRLPQKNCTSLQSNNVDKLPDSPRGQTTPPTSINNINQIQGSFKQTNNKPRTPSNSVSPFILKPSGTPKASPAKLISPSLNNNGYIEHRNSSKVTSCSAWTKLAITLQKGPDQQQQPQKPQQINLPPQQQHPPPTPPSSDDSTVSKQALVGTSKTSDQSLSEQQIKAVKSTQELSSVSDTQTNHQDKSEINHGPSIETIKTASSADTKLDTPVTPKPHPIPQPQQQPQKQQQPPQEPQQQKVTPEKSSLVQNQNQPKGTPTMTPPPNKSANKARGWLAPDQGTFSWENYLSIKPATCAPKEAFRQADPPPANKFQIGMKLEARDPRATSWCLATIISIHGIRLHLRFDGCDETNDFHELIDSANIRPVNSTTDPLYAPMGFKTRPEQYSNFLDKQLSMQGTVLAPATCFLPPPKKPAKNLFQVGMKLEAVDSKCRTMICPATIARVEGNKVRVSLDGYSESYTYTTDYYDRDLFPVNWCKSTNHFIQLPQGYLETCVAKNNSPDQSHSTSKKSKVTVGSKTPKKVRPSSSGLTNSSKKDSRPKGRPKKSAKTIARDSADNSDKTLPRRDSSATPTTTVNLTPPPNDSPSSEEFKQEDRSSGEKTSGIDISSGDDHQIEKAEEEEEMLTDEQRFKCQRALPINEWLNKKKSKQMPHLTNQTAAESDIDVNNSSYTSNSSHASTVSYQQQQASSKQHQHQPSPSNTKGSVEKQGNGSLPQTTVGSGSAPTTTTSITNSAASKPSMSPPPSKRSRFDATVSPDSSVRLKRKEILRSKSRSLSTWTVRDVLDIIQVDESLAKYSNVFQDHEIDGKAFILLSTDMMINHMGIKIGPVLKIGEIIDQVKRYQK